MRSTNLRFVAQCRGNRFDVAVRALKGYYGLLECPYALVKGDRLVLSPVQAGATPAFSRVQLFARIIMPHPERSIYETVWEKLVSPTGLTVMMEYMQSNLGICISSNHLCDVPWVDKELAYFDFASATVNYPGRGQCLAQKVDAVQSVRKPVTVTDVAPAAVRPLRRNPLLTPSSPVRSGSQILQSAPPKAPPALGPVGPQADGLSMYGLKSLDEAFELADQIPVLQDVAAALTKTSPIGKPSSATRSGQEGSVTTLLRNLATHLSGKSPFEDDKGNR